MTSAANGDSLQDEKASTSTAVLFLTLLWSGKSSVSYSADVALVFFTFPQQGRNILRRNDVMAIFCKFYFLGLFPYRHVRFLIFGGSRMKLRVGILGLRSTHCCASCIVYSTEYSALEKAKIQSRSRWDLSFNIGEVLGRVQARAVAKTRNCLSFLH